MDRSKLSAGDDPSDRLNFRDMDRTSYLKSFLDSSPTLPEQQSSPSQIADNPNCPVCQTPLPTDKKRICKFCSYNICKNHLRKKRELKGKFQRICDNCQDKYLNDRFLKYEGMADEADAIQEQILCLKLQDTHQIIRAKKMAVKVQEQKVHQMNRKHQQKHDILMSEYKIMLEKDKDLDGDFTRMADREKEIKEMQEKMPRSLEEDHKALTDEGQKLNKELLKLEKRVQELKASISRKEKEVLENYQKWEKGQTNKKAPHKEQSKQGCSMF